MLTEDVSKKLKEILLTLNHCDVSLEEFYETIEKETGGKLTFSSFKNYLDKYYPSINKCKINLT
jgi:hypothetical protein